MKKPGRKSKPAQDDEHRARQERYEKQKAEERDYTAKRIPTPNLDNFSGVAGSWC